MGLAERKTSRPLLNRPRGWSTRRQDEVVSDVWPPSLESKFRRPFKHTSGLCLPPRP